VSAATCPDEDALLGLVTGDTDPAVRAHTDSCPACKQRLEGMSVGLATLRNLFLHETVTHEAGTDAHRGPADRPVQIGKYFIIGTLGEGAQAVVYRGLHGTLNKEVVIKLGRHLVEGGAIDRAHLVNEGKVLAMLDHPNLARVLDLDFYEGRPFLVMEYIEGVNLEEYAAGAKLTPAACADLVAKLASALAVAHREGVVHHDIKPANVLVDDTGRPVLIDFGLAWLRHAEGKKLEETHAPGGTLAWMSPEHARGEVEKIGPKSDLFALGGVLLFLLTGKPPFNGPDAFTIQQKAMRCDLDLAGLDRSDIPRPLAALCKQALSPLPQDRPVSAEALARDLEKAAGATKRSRWVLPSALAACAAGAIGLGAWLWPSPKPLPPAPGVQRLVRLYQRTEGGKTRRFPHPDLPAYVTNGDLVEVDFEIPRDSEARLFWIGSSGEVRERTPAVAGEGALGPRLRYPPDRQARISGPPGTEFILVVASRRGRPLLHLGQMEEILRETCGQGPLPALRPDDPQLLLSRAGIEEDMGKRDIEGEVDTPLTVTRARLEALRQELLKHCDWCWGVALPHR
jgi:tRNA A-37 threonylcarbamoyl transferase component Bud32